MSIFYIPLYDVWAMGIALTIAITLFAALFVIPFAVVWFIARGIGNGWRWLATSTSRALPGHAPR
jgi:hypothetical protein